MTRRSARHNARCRPPRNGSPAAGRAAGIPAHPGGPGTGGCGARERSRARPGAYSARIPDRDSPVLRGLGQRPMNDPFSREVNDLRSACEALRGELARVIVGQREALDLVVIALLAGGHVLLEGVPGLGKTLLVRTLAQTLHLRLSRVQF